MAFAAYCSKCKYPGAILRRDMKCVNCRPTGVRAAGSRFAPVDGAASGLIPIGGEIEVADPVALAAQCHNRIHLGLRELEVENLEILFHVRGR